MKKNKLQMLLEVAIFAAIAFLLDLFFPSISPVYKISFKMLPVVIVALRWGMPAGLMSGFIWGLLQVITGEAWIINLPQALVDYFFAFTAVGVAGIFHKKVQNALAGERVDTGKLTLFSVLATIVGPFCRYIFHFISGIWFFPDTANPALNSLIFNGTGYLSETITCLVVLILLLPLSKQILRNRAALAE